ncbi:MAG: YeeE/YedE thiosulfate transporter family protein [Saprospiraceae bacterium]
MNDFLSQPWPWYIAGPVIGLMIPALLLLGNKAFGISSSLKHICAACFPGNIPFFRYNWKKEAWSLVLAAGILIGGFIGGVIFKNPEPVAISTETVQDLNALGVTHDANIHPKEIFNFNSLLTLRGFLLIVVGGFLVGFGTRYAGGCTSGHTIMGISNLQMPSVIASCFFFAGGLLMTWFILPIIFNL